MVRDRLYFSSVNAAGQRNLWVTDGTPGATGQINYAGASVAGLSPSSFATAGGKVFFAGSSSGPNQNLYVLDPATSILTEITRAGASPIGLSPSGITALGGAVLFSARNANGSLTLWRSDGTAAGTTELPVAGQAPTGLYPAYFAPLGNKLAFSGSDAAPGNLYVTDGTAAGTTKVPVASPILNIQDMASLGDRVVFAANSPSGRQALWVSDGTAAGTATLPVPGLNPAGGYDGDPAGLTAFGARVAFTAAGESGAIAVWTTDGTAAGTTPLPGLTAPASGTPMAALPDGRLAFIATDVSGKPGIWLTDGVTTVPVPVPGANAAGLNPSSVLALGDGLVFDGLDTSGARVLFTSDGTAAGTAILATGVTLVGGPGLSGGDASAAIPGDTVRGTVRNDLLADTPADQLINGYAGRDTLLLADGFRASTVALPGNGDVALTHGGQSDTVRGIEELRFIDGRLVFDANDPAAQVTRLYQAALGRAPDQGGLNFWIGAVGRGTPLAGLAQGFLQSPEFIARFGDNLGNPAFVTRIYNNVLGRDPDAGGLQFFTGNLDNGLATRAEVLAGISESAENKAITAPLVAAGIWDRSEAAQQVARLYDTALGRLPDTGGLAFWTGAIERGAAALTDLAGAFVASPEFAAAYGALGNQAFVEKIYDNTLGRAGDAEGVQFWTGSLNSGTSRATVAIGFSESPEHQLRTAANVGGEVPGTFGVRLA